MYLDTDIILAIAKPSDWLAPHVNLKKLKNPQTSVSTIIEAEIVLSREFGRNAMLRMIEKIRNEKISLMPLDAKVLEKSVQLLKLHDNLTIFDSLHAAFAIVNKDVIISTDFVFDQIEGVIRIDPRKMK